MLLVSVLIENHVRAFLSDFKTILTGSSFLGLRSSVFGLRFVPALKILVKIVSKSSRFVYFFIKTFFF